jgi:hypothetical protein
MGEMRERILRGELYIAGDPENAAAFDPVQELQRRVQRLSVGRVGTTAMRCCATSEREFSCDRRASASPARSDESGAMP